MPSKQAISANAFFSMLGLAMRAGALTTGEDGVRKAVASGKALLVLVDEGASANTKKLFADACTHYGTPMALTLEGRLGEAIGKPGRMSAAVARGPLGEKLLALAGKENAGVTGDAPVGKGNNTTERE